MNMALEDRNVLARFGIPVAVKYDDYHNKLVVTEIPRPDSVSTRARQALEQDLTTVIANQIFNDPSAVKAPPAVNHFVAVRRKTHAYWSRGQVQDIYHMYQKIMLRVFLLDWGDSEQFPPSDVVPLPRAFVDKPCFAKTADLFGICPLSKELDPLTLQLVSSKAAGLDQGAKSFLRGMISKSCASQMVIYGSDAGQNLSIRLYLNESDPDDEHAWSCVNDILCHKHYAVADDQSREPLPVRISAWYEDLETISGDEVKSDIGFLEFAREYEERTKRAVGERAAQEEMRGIQGSTAEFTSKGRGMRALLLQERDVTAVPGSYSTTAPPTQDETLQHAQSTYPVAPTRVPNIEKNATVVQCSSRPDSALQTPDSTGSDPNNSACDINAELAIQKPGTTENILPQPAPRTIPPKLGRSLRNYLRDTEVKDVVGSSPAAISLSQQQKDTDLTTTFKRTQTIGSSTAAATPVVGSPPKAHTQLRTPLTTAGNEFEIADHQDQVRSSPHTPTGPEYLPKKGLQAAELAGEAPQRSLRMLIGASGEDLKRPCNSQDESRPNLTCTVAEEVHITDAQAAEDLQTAGADQSGDVADPLDMTSEVYQLLQLCKTVSSPPDVVAGPSDSDNMQRILSLPSLQPSKYVLSSGKQHVLAISSLHKVQPIRSVRDLPFHPTLVSSLQRLGITKPSNIQSYVWNAIRYGQDVAYVAGPSSGLTLGFLVPILNAVITLPPSLPRGASPVVVVLCASWRTACRIHDYCVDLMRGVSSFKSAVFHAGMSEHEHLIKLLDGYTLLAATPPALLRLLEYSEGLINFSRCCHLVFDEAEILVGEYAGVISSILERYVAAKNATQREGLVRQVVACARKWTPGFESLIDNVLQEPSVFIGSPMEAAVYGLMKVTARWLKKARVDDTLLEILRDIQRVKTLVFCPSVEEAGRIGALLKANFDNVLVTHDDDSVFETDQVSRLWKEGSLSQAPILVCTDDTLVRLDISDAVCLIHYPSPELSRLGFGQRLACALDNLNSRIPTGRVQTECHLLLTKACREQLLTLARLIRRTGFKSDEELESEAALAYLMKEAKKEGVSLCSRLKSFGFCRVSSTCQKRHIIIDSLDKASVPQIGLARVLITAVRSGSRYFGRILLCRSKEDETEYLRGKLEMLEKRLDEYYKSGAADVIGNSVNLGQVYGFLTKEDRFVRIRAKKVTEVNSLQKPVRIKVQFLETGITSEVSISELYRLPDSLKQEAPLAVEILLAGIKPLDYDDSWTDAVSSFVKGKILNKELEGRIVLGMGNTIWVESLIERNKIAGMTVYNLNLRHELLTSGFAERNPKHLNELYTLGKSGGLEIPDYHADWIVKAKRIQPGFAFLPLGKSSVAYVSTLESPSRFYVQQDKFADLLDDLEKDLKEHAITRKKLLAESVRVGFFYMAKYPDLDTWHRARILNVNDEMFEVFFVDHGDSATVGLEDLRSLSQQYVTKLPFQAIACTLSGIRPRSDVEWPPEAADLLRSMIRIDDILQQVKIRPFVKESEVDDITEGPLYKVSLSIGGRDAAQVLIESGLAESVEEVFTVPEGEDQSEEAEITEDEFNEEDFEGFGDWVDLFPFLQQERDSQDRQESQESPGISKEPTTEPQKVQPVVLEQKPGFRYPTSKWFQTGDRVVLNIALNCRVYEARLEQDRLFFAAQVNGLSYEIDLEWFLPIDVEESRHSADEHVIRVDLRKKDPTEWDRLFKPKLSMDWLRFDFDHFSHQAEHEQGWEKINYVDIDLEKAFGSGDSDDVDTTDVESYCSDESD